jgi:UDP-N-acetylglucosamine 2-epimerase (non-hydrolysing)
MRIVNTVGARPNFMKIAPLIAEMARYGECQSMLVHTGQHYDYDMSKAFFSDLGLPEPDVHLETGPGTQSEQTGQIMIRFERVLRDLKPDVVVVVGDVNSTLACALAACKLHIPVAHVEAGLRSFDRRMPEEINRLLVDAISEYLFVTEESGVRNLLREGIPEEKVFFVGNVMIDTLMAHRERASGSPILSRLMLKENDYAVATLHRPENVDSEVRLKELLSTLDDLSRLIRVVYPIHPRARRRMDELRLPEKLSFLSGNDRFVPTKPLSYLDFLKLLMGSQFVLTDSGGIQEETTFLGIPCLTLRGGTERPCTVEDGTNTIVGTDRERVLAESTRILDGHPKEGKLPKLWDGHAAERIVKILLKRVESGSTDD